MMMGLFCNLNFLIVNCIDILNFSMTLLKTVKSLPWHTMRDLLFFCGLVMRFGAFDMFDNN